MEAAPQVLTGQDVLVSVLVLVLRSLSLLTAVQQFTLLLLQRLHENRNGFTTCGPPACCKRSLQETAPNVRYAFKIRVF